MAKVNWRFISTPPAPGAWNMALDETLYRRFYESPHVPVLRIYGWQPCALSFGRFQDTRSIREYDDIDYVRRMTGGGAILHDHEITYSLTASAEHIPGIADVRNSYTILTSFILETCRALGLSPVYAAEYYPEMFSQKQREKSFICFEGLEPADIVIQGRKIGGNAQYRRGNTVFQHGSVPLVLNRQLTARVFGDTSKQSCMTSLAELSVTQPRDLLIETMKEAFQATLKCTVHDSSVSEDEHCETQGLVHTKYTDRDWTWERKQRRQTENHRG